MELINPTDYISREHMHNNLENISRSQLLKMQRVAEDATQGTWHVIEDAGYGVYAKCIPEVHGAQWIATCMPGIFSFRRDNNSHIFLFETRTENAKANAIYIANFHPERTKTLIKERMRLANFIKNIYSILDTSQQASIDSNLLKRIQATFEMKSYNSLLKIANAATPGSWSAIGERDDIVRTSWKWSRKRYICDKNSNNIPETPDMSVKCIFKFDQYGDIYAYESKEDQHKANARYIAKFCPTEALTLIKQLIDFQKIIIKLFTLLSHTQAEALGDDLVNKIHDEIAMSKK